MMSEYLFELLTIAAQDFEQKDIPDRGILLGCLLKILLQKGLPHLRVTCLFLNFAKHFRLQKERQFLFMPSFIRLLVR